MTTDGLPLSRRQYLAATSLATGSLLFSGSGAAGAVGMVPDSCSEVPDNAKGPEIPEKGYLVEEIRDDLYWLTDGGYIMMFLVTGAGVVAVDAPPALGENIGAAIEEVTDEPVTHVVYSHSHADHIGAASMYPDDAAIIANERTADLLDRYDDPNRPAPTVTYDESYTLWVGEKTLQLDYRGVNHSVDNTFIYAPEQETLMLVDVVYPGWVPFRGLASFVPGFVEAHDQVLEYDFETFVGGHRTRLGTREDVRTQRKYVSDVREAVETAMGSVSFAEATEGVNPEDAWAMVEAYYTAIVEEAAPTVLEEWCDRLGGAAAFTPSHCLAMLQSLQVDYGGS